VLPVARHDEEMSGIVNYFKDPEIPGRGQREWRPQDVTGFGIGVEVRP
jgi:hypothetical protein